MNSVDPATSAPLRPAAAVIGSGTWDTTFASLLAQTGTPTTIWARRREVAKEISPGINERYVPGHRLSQGPKTTTDLAQAAAGASIVVVAIPSQEARRALESLRGALVDDAVAASPMKDVGLGTGLRMSEVLTGALDIDSSRAVVVSDPNLVNGIAAGQPTATVVAADDEQVAARIALLCATGTFRPYTNTDALGVEPCGAVKNVIALIVDAAAGRGLGDNSKATIIAWGLTGITRLGLRLGARPETFSELAGMGDLVATRSSPSNCNQTFDRHLGEGMSVTETTATPRGVAEGTKSARAVLGLARAHGVDTLIAAGVVTVVKGAASIAQVTGALLTRPRKSEGVHMAPPQAWPPRGVETCFIPGSLCIISMSGTAW